MNATSADIVTHGVVDGVYSSQENDLRKSNGYDEIFVD